MKKLLIAPILVASTLVAGCGERWDRFTRLLEIAGEFEQGYTSSKYDKKREMAETRKELDNALKIADKNRPPQ
ncbi:hypothetical protein HOA55_01040 [archaeon]|jgi:hypothetical protein|nr:hypothetical protein [archaeon]MBT3577545.1 hypothetical protein [archaeon]MBT6819920.1 hypothetical protein [archaeon]MBT6956670.1 hypothetical protein [archaeon]MBT7025076.1 hypothetical protein [archaeon]